MNGTTSLVRWSAEFPLAPLTHSVSVLKAPPESTKTSTGAFPWCAAANSSLVLIPLPARSQSAGVLNSPPIIISVGSAGGGFEANQAGGRYTSSSRCLNPDAAALIVTGTTDPLLGICRAL